MTPARSPAAPSLRRREREGDGVSAEAPDPLQSLSGWVICQVRLRLDELDPRTHPVARPARPSRPSAAASHPAVAHSRPGAGACSQITGELITLLEPGCRSELPTAPGGPGQLTLGRRSKLTTASRSPARPSRPSAAAPHTAAAHARPGAGACSQTTSELATLLECRSRAHTARCTACTCT